MSNTKPRTIPSWQPKDQEHESAKSHEADPSTSDSNITNLSDQGSASSDPESASPSHESLIDSAARWLQDDSIRDASLASKAAFLESKGLAQPEIDQLLQNSSSRIDTSSTDSSTAKPVATSNTPSLSSTADTPKPPPFKNSQSPPPPPPIITYPEFLAHAHRPPPLVTASRVLNAAYATAFTSAVLWGTSRYLLTPMVESLTAARHSLFEGTISNLAEMNEKLENVVSVVPSVVDIPGDSIKDGIKNGLDDDADSEASDPAEMFHRDVGVQTSPSLSMGDDGAAAVDEEGGLTVPVDAHAENLKEIKKHLVELAETNAETLSAEEETRTSIGNLQAYLDELAYGGRKGPISWEGGYGPLGEPMGSSRGSGSTMDEIAKFKSEIRSVKGALLSARNFPIGGLGRGRTPGVSLNTY